MLDVVKYLPHIWGMENNETLKPLKVDRTKLITQTKYAQQKGVSKQYINQQVKSGKLASVEIIGATLVLLD